MPVLRTHIPDPIHVMILLPRKCQEKSENASPVRFMAQSKERTSSWHAPNESPKHETVRMAMYGRACPPVQDGNSPAEANPSLEQSSVLTCCSTPLFQIIIYLIF